MSGSTDRSRGPPRLNERTYPTKRAAAVAELRELAAGRGDLRADPTW